MKNNFHNDLKSLMDTFVKIVYAETRNFPKDELYGIVSQLRRAALSVILNYIEGYARQRRAVLKNFLEISYGSLKESRYLIYLSHDQGYLKPSSYERLNELSDKIGAMLYGTIRKI